MSISRGMASSVFILGHQPELSRAELAAVLPAAFHAVGPSVLVGTWGLSDVAGLLARLGGTVKIGELIAPVFTPETVADQLTRGRPAGKRARFGISWYAKTPRPRQLAAGLAVKRLLRQRGVSARLVTAKTAVLPAAAVNRHGAIEFLVLPDGSLARTLAVQDVDDFTRRDVGRPHRDLRSGTLPPKLARIMVNLARIPPGGSLLDPFCGSGTILTEAALAGVQTVAGADISPAAVEQSRRNLEWLQRHYPSVAAVAWSVRPSDARALPSTMAGQKFDAVVSEPYLGPPRHGRETLHQLRAVVTELAALYRDAFAAFSPLLKPAGRVVFMTPVLVHGRQALAVPLAAAVQRLGFMPAGGPWGYARPNQWVRREIWVWKLTR